MICASGQQAASFRHRLVVWPELTHTPHSALLQDHQALLSIDGGFPAVTLGPWDPVGAGAAAGTATALWLHWGAYSRRLPLPSSVLSLTAGVSSRQSADLDIVLVR